MEAPVILTTQKKCPNVHRTPSRDALIKNIENPVETHVKTVKIPASALFTGECTIAEMEEILATAETKLAGDVSFTLRDLLEELKISDN